MIREADDATPCGWPAAAGHPQGVALLYTTAHQRHECIVYSRATPLGVNLRPPQATRKGWPY